VIVYAESSAVLAWLLGESAGRAVHRLLAEAERVVASRLTPIECARALARGAALGELDPSGAGAAGRMLDRVARSWALMEMTGPALNSARQRFPVEPVRTLDALHLGAALEFERELGGLTLVSLDARIRDNAAALRLAVAP
jgi:uncharacterized protein with PIN domain